MWVDTPKDGFRMAHCSSFLTHRGQDRTEQRGHNYYVHCTPHVVPNYFLLNSHGTGKYARELRKRSQLCGLAVGKRLTNWSCSESLEASIKGLREARLFLFEIMTACQWLLAQPRVCTSNTRRIGMPDREQERGIKLAAPLFHHLQLCAWVEGK